jgi:hypothetical protein
LNAPDGCSAIQGAALPWDDQLQPKPAFYGIADGLQNIDDSGLTGTTSSTTVSSTTSTTPTSSSSTTTTPSSTPSPLNDLAVAAGKEYFGTAVAYQEYLNATYKVNLDNIHLFGKNLYSLGYAYRSLTLSPRANDAWE